MRHWNHGCISGCRAGRGGKSRNMTCSDNSYVGDDALVVPEHRMLQGDFGRLSFGPEGLLEPIPIGGLLEWYSQHRNELLSSHL
jgi:hypothetical protein